MKEEKTIQNPLDGISDEMRSMLRPDGIINGIMKVDFDKCTKCGLCVENCPFKCWEPMETDTKVFPKLKRKYICFSCFNCMIACKADAISIGQTFKVEGGFFDTDFPEIKWPREPRDEDGRPDEWNEVEKTILMRRTVRNFKKKPVPEPLINRIIEAGRFSPSSGNHQPWKFTVVTDPGFIAELDATCQKIWEKMYLSFEDDNEVSNMVDLVETGVFDPRVQYGMRCVATKELPVFFGAPVVIFIGINSRMANPAIATGICGLSMNLAAASLDLGFCWGGFATILNTVPEIKSKLGFDDQWDIGMAVSIGYPAFKQRGMIPRNFRPITWFRPGKKHPEVET